MIGRLLLLGATGDLAGRFLLPALADLSAAGRLPADLQVVGSAAEPWDDAAFRTHAADRLQAHAGDVPAAVRDELVGRLRYSPLDPTVAGTAAAAVRAFDRAGGDPRPVAAYLALPPPLFPPVLTALGGADLPPGSRVAVEKPFGADLAGAVALDELLTRVTGGVAGAAYRVDHFLGMPTVRELLAARSPGGPLAGIWDGGSLRQVDVLWEESLGLEGRAGFYDRTGALRDVLQNHLLQVLALIAMEVPPGTDDDALHAAKLDVLRAVRPLAPADVPARTRRARWSAGTLTGPGGRRPVPAYADEDGVDAARGTETWAELVLELDTPRWAGTRFVLRTGKGLGTSRKGVALHLRGGAADVDPRAARRTAGDRLWVPLEAPDGEPVPAERIAYRDVLGDLLSGGSRFSVSGEEAEQAWRVVDPVLRAWAAGAVPLLDYPAGSDGPPPPATTPASPGTV